MSGPADLQHIAIIMDGNGRWATRQGLSRSQGHQAGAKSVREILSAAQEVGVRHLTLYAFSTENWGRPEAEVKGLFELLLKYLESELTELKANKICLKTIGDLSSFPPEVRDCLQIVQDQTAAWANDFVLTLALSYGSQAELARAARLLATEVAQGTLAVEDITPQAIDERLWTTGTPTPDLLIRTGGDMRLSNFLLWQCAYTELYFTPTLWPDFGAKDFREAVASFKSRERRYGLAGPPSPVPPGPNQEPQTPTDLKS